jgi:hypothetical protein
MQSDKFLILIYKRATVSYFKKYVDPLVHQGVDDLDEYEPKIDRLNELIDYLATFSNIDAITIIDLNLFNMYLTNIINLPKRIMVKEYSTDSLAPLTLLMNLNEMILEGWNGSLEPLKNTSVRKLLMNRFDGDLSPLENMSIKIN